MKKVIPTTGVAMILLMMVLRMYSDSDDNRVNDNDDEDENSVDDNDNDDDNYSHEDGHDVELPSVMLIMMVRSV